MKIRQKPFVGFVLVIIILALGSFAILFHKNIVFTLTTPMPVARNGYSAVLLANGKVLVVGGWDISGNFLASAELYDPVTGTWAATGDMATGRVSPLAVLLPNGKVLVAGGMADHKQLSSAELYDPKTGSWAATGDMKKAYLGSELLFAKAMLLPNGKVVVVGTGDRHGRPDDDFIEAELYDPATGQWTVTGDTSKKTLLANAILLRNGKVLVMEISDNISNKVELFDPATGLWTVTGAMNCTYTGFTATLLPNGKVLAAGGLCVPIPGSGPSDSAELYDPATGKWTATGAMNFVRGEHTATLLPNGKVLVVGGVVGMNTLASAELYDPATEKWTNIGELNTSRRDPTATLLPNGTVLVLGGEEGHYRNDGPIFRMLHLPGFSPTLDRKILDSAELYNPAP